MTPEAKETVTNVVNDGLRQIANGTMHVTNFNHIATIIQLANNGDDLAIAAVKSKRMATQIRNRPKLREMLA